MCWALSWCLVRSKALLHAHALDMAKAFAERQEQGRTLVVEDVDAFPGHIACSALSRSEVVVPVKDQDGRVAAVLDIDSTALAEFDTVDEQALEQFCALLQPLC